MKVPFRRHPEIATESSWCIPKANSRQENPFLTQTLKFPPAWWWLLQGCGKTRKTHIEQSSWGYSISSQVKSRFGVTTQPHQQVEEAVLGTLLAPTSLRNELDTEELIKKTTVLCGQPWRMLAPLWGHVPWYLQSMSLVILTLGQMEQPASSWRTDNTGTYDTHMDTVFCLLQQ